MRNRIIFTNSFHNTKSSVVPQAITDGRFKGLHQITRNTVLRLRRELCGVSGCTCGGTFGEREGAYLNIVNEDSNRNYIIDIRASRP